MSPEPFWDRPCAARGLISYRYGNGPYGFVMIGAKDDADALNEASRSVSGNVYPDRLERWNGRAYVPVRPSAGGCGVTRFTARRRPLSRYAYGRIRFTFHPVPACLANIILETQARHGVTLAKDFAK